MSDDLIKRSDAIKIMACEMYAEAQSNGYEVDSIEDFMPEAKAWMNDVPSADRPQGYWTKTDVATYRCSECGKIQIADDVNELNYCCCCGSRNKVRRKGADDE